MEHCSAVIKKVRGGVGAVLTELMENSLTNAVS